MYERDRSPVDGLAGYRLSISRVGRRALDNCLSRAPFVKLLANCAKPSQSVSFLDHWLNYLLAIDLPQDAQSPDSELPVSRIALRRVLLDGVEPVVRFGKRFVRFEGTADDLITAHFDDGTTAIGDVLVGADGANSAVRAQLLPQAERIDTGIVAVSGRIPLDYNTRRVTPAPILRGPTLVLAPRGRFLFASTVDYDENGQSATLVPQPPRYDRGKYVMWGISARRASFAGPKDVLELSGAELKGLVLTLMERWHPSLGRMVRNSDPGTVSAFAVKTSVPVKPWPTRNVTLLGDALHNMTPFRGMGANAALRDAAALRRALRTVDRGEAELIPALAVYEREMIEHGFAAVRASLRDMQRFHSERWLHRLATRAFFRTLDHLPPLKRMVLGR